MPDQSNPCVRGRVEAICTGLLNAVPRPATDIEPSSVPKDWGIYLWRCIESGEPVYVGSAVGQWGLYQRIVENHLRPGYWKKRKGEEQSVFRKAVAAAMGLTPGRECVAFIKGHFSLAFLECSEDQVEVIKEAEDRLIAELNPRYNDRGKGNARIVTHPPSPQGLVVTKAQWLELHKVCMDTVRSAIRGLSGDALAAKPLPHDDSIGEQANHVIGAETYWLREVHIEPRFQKLERQSWTESRFLEEFAKIERQYEEILGEKGLDRDILFGLGRVCLHALYHCARMLTLRWALEPDWKPEPLRWERAVDFITDLLIVGPEAKPRYDGG